MKITIKNKKYKIKKSTMTAIVILLYTFLLLTNPFEFNWEHMQKLTNLFLLAGFIKAAFIILLVILKKKPIKRSKNLNIDMSKISNYRHQDIKPTTQDDHQPPIQP